MTVGSASLGAAHGEIRISADLRGVRETAAAFTALERQSASVGASLSRNLTPSGAGLEQITTQVTKSNEALKSAALAGGIVGAAMVGGLGLAVDAAGDLNAAIASTQQVFGDAADEMETFAEGAATALGLSERAALQAAVALGSLFLSIGKGEAESADLSQRLITAAADLAAFTDAAGGTEAALDAIRAALRGEADPIEKYNIRVNEAAVNAKALELGLAGSNSELTEQDKILARTQLIFDQLGPAAGAFAREQGQLGTSTETARAQIENASAALGQLFLPAVAAAAQGIGKLAEGFTGMSQTMQQVAGAAVAAGAGLLVMASAAVKIAGLVAGLKDIVAALRASQAAAAAFSLAMGPVGIAVAAAAAAAFLAIRVYQDHDRAIKTLSDDYQGLARAINEAKLAGDASLVTGLTALNAQLTEIHDNTNSAEDAFKSLLTTVGTGDLSTVVEGTNLSLRELFDQYKEGILTQDQFNKINEQTEQVLETQGIDIGNVTRIIGESFDQYKLWIDTQGRAGISGDELAARMENLTLHTADYMLVEQDATQTTEEETQALAENVKETIKKRKEQQRLSKAVQATTNAAFLAGRSLLLPFTRNAEDAEQATNQFTGSLDEMIRSSLDAVRGVEDMAPALDGMQTGFTDAKLSVTDTVLALDKIGVVNLSPAVRQALEFASALVKVEADIARVEDAIANNQDDLAMWQGRIDLVSDVFGVNTDVIAEWERQLQEGEGTQNQFSQAINQYFRTAGNLPKLDALLAQGRISREEYNAAIEAGIHLTQRSAGGIQDEEAELVRNVIALDKYVTKHDEADGAVKDLTEEQRGYIAAMQDSAVATALQMVQLLAYLAVVGAIPPEAVTEYIVNASDANATVKALFEDVGLLTEDGKVIPFTVDAKAADQALDDIEQRDLPTKTVEVVPVVRGDAFLLDPSRGATAGLAAEQAPITIPVVVSDEATPQLTVIAADVAAVADGATTAGASVGPNFAAGVAASTAAATNAIGALRRELNVAFGGIPQDAKDWGNVAGQWFAAGLADGIQAGRNRIYQAAYAVAYAAYLGAKAALGIRSPSTVAMELATNFSQTFLDGIAGHEAQATTAGEDLIGALIGGMGGAAKTAIAAPRPAPLAALAPVTAASGGARTVIAGGISITVNGSGDPETVAQRVYRALDDAFGRLELESRR
ncbi:MAG TPA: hypothetical protein VH475_23205 [Tepidisphaeraceae bacterium]|jgi:hypothetical protein